MKQDLAIDIDKLTVRFDKKRVFEEFSLSLTMSEKVILTGDSGSGKSTILRCILGFVIPQQGSIHINRELLTRESVWRLRTRIAYVAQEPDLGSGQVRGIIERPFTYRANAHLRKNLEQVPMLFKRLNLPLELLDKDITSLSGGEKQRVAFISAILLDRQILLLDEASSALDETNRIAMTEFFRSDNKLTVLAVSHDQKSFSGFNRTIELPNGYNGANE